MTAVARGTAAREAALTILESARRGDLFQVARDRAVVALEDRDRRLAEEIAAGVLRSRRSLDDRLRRAVTRPWARTPDDLRDILRIGLYQLTALSRVPPHAAVAEAVEMAKSRHGAASGAFVNAILRRILREPAPEAADVPPRTPVQRLAEAHSHPDWLVSRWHARFGAEDTERLLRHNNTRPPLSIAPVGWTRDAVLAGAVHAGIDVEAPADGTHLIVRTRRPAHLPGFAEGAFVVQGPAQALLLARAGLAAGTRVWDACASPGGKAAVLSRTMRVITSDRAGTRMVRLRDTLRRTAPGVPAFAADARQPPIRIGAVDAVWLDAPCSATGTMAQHPDARWRLGPRRLAALAALQEALLDGVAPVVTSGGRLVYSTCSLEPEENEHQVDGFLTRHADFRRSQPDVFVFPPDTGADGGYLAVLLRA